MKVKIDLILFVLYFLLPFQITCNTQRTCKTQVVQSFTLTSRIVPNRMNSVCPQVSLNCCTSHDQMRIHKIWTMHAGPNIERTHNRALDEFKRLRPFFMYKDRIKTNDLVKMYQKYTKKKAHPKFMIHLYDLASKLGEIKGNELTDGFDSMLNQMKKFHAHIMHLRKSLLCAICNWHNHRYINPPSMTITYNTKFCMKMVFKFIDVLGKKYKKYVQTVLLVDELVYLLSGQRLIESALHRAILQRYILILDKCMNNPNSFPHCQDFCSQFNLNRFSFIFDGELGVFKKFMSRFKDVQFIIIGDPSSFDSLYKLKKDIWKGAKTAKFRKKSMLSKKIQRDPLAPKPKKNAFQLEFSSQPIKKYIERKHATNSIQIETLDDSLSAYTLYRLAEKPTDIAKYVIKYDTKGGLNPFKDSKKLNIDFSTHKILALIHMKGNNEFALNEVLEDQIKYLLDNLKITDLGTFLSDSIITFDKVAKKKEPKGYKPGKGSEKKMGKKNVVPPKKKKKGMLEWLFGIKSVDRLVTLSMLVSMAYLI